MKILKEQVMESAPLTEKVNPANAEINAKIFRTLKTKKTVEPKFGEDLAKHGLEIVGGEDSHSVQGYYAVKGPNGNSLCISKDMDKKLGLFDQWNRKVYADAFDKFDYLNYLTSPDAAQDNRNYSGRKPYFKDPKASYTYSEDDVNDTTRKFANAKGKLKDLKDPSAFTNRYHTDNISKLESDIAKALKSIEYHKQQLANNDKQAAEELQKAADILAAVRARHQKK